MWRGQADGSLILSLHQMFIQVSPPPFAINDVCSSGGWTLGITPNYSPVIIFRG